MKKKGYFKGWYYKQEKDGQMIALIPAFHYNKRLAGRAVCRFSKEGKGSASVQVITGERSWNFDFPMEAVRYRGGDRIRIGNCFFSPEGIRVDLHGEAAGELVTIRGRLTFGPPDPLKYDICGPLRYLPGMQCRHSVLSMGHRVRGALYINGERLELHGGRGYLEKDWGSSFPGWYFWCQSNWKDGEECSLMAAVAEVSLCGLHFPGCIACVHCGGKEYRFATYLGVRILRFGRGELLLKQGRLCLSIRVRPEEGQTLRAPVCGKMERLIRESPSCKFWCRLWKDGKLILEHVGSASAEFVGLRP